MWISTCLYWHESGHTVAPAVLNKSVWFTTMRFITSHSALFHVQILIPLHPNKCLHFSTQPLSQKPKRFLKALGIRENRQTVKPQILLLIINKMFSL